MAANSRLLELASPLGLEAETLELLPLLPLVYVAWSDGEIQAEELSVILEFAETRGLKSETSLELLQGWLDARPGEAFFKEGLKVLSYLVASLPADEAKAAAGDVTELCDAVARASGGLSGHTVNIDASERLALRKVAVRLDLGSKPNTRVALQKILDTALDL